VQPILYICISQLCLNVRPRSGVVGWDTMLQAGRSRDLFPKRSLDLFNLPNPSSRTMALGSTQPPSETNSRNIHGVKRGRGLDKFTAICEPTL
jgi:hypothetical protein